MSASRIMQLVAFLEANHALDVRRGHGRGHVNFYRILREEDGLPVPLRSRKKKVKSEGGEKVQFPTPPEPEKVKCETPKPLETQENTADKVVDTKEREDKEEPPVSLCPHDGADAPEDDAISPEVMRKFSLRYGVEDWPPPRREKE